MKEKIVICFLVRYNEVTKNVRFVDIFQDKNQVLFVQYDENIFSYCHFSFAILCEKVDGEGWGHAIQ